MKQKQNMSCFGLTKICLSDANGRSNFRNYRHQNWHIHPRICCPHTWSCQESCGTCRKCSSTDMLPYHNDNATISQLAMPFNRHFTGSTGWAGAIKIILMWIILKQETVSGSGISWVVCKSAPCSRHTTTPASHHSVYTGRMPFLSPNQQRQRTEGNNDAY